MVSTHTIYGAPPDSGSLILGRTLPSLLDEGCDRYPNEKALNQWQKRSWQSLSNISFRRAVEKLALGLITLGLQKGDRVALVMDSDISFCLVDMGCLLAGLIDVPIDLTQTIENIRFIAEHTEAKALVISNLDLLYQIIPYLEKTPGLESVIVADVPRDWEEVRKELVEEVKERIEVNPSPGECLHIPKLLYPVCKDNWSGTSHCVPHCVQVWSLAEVQRWGEEQWSEEVVKQLREAIAPSDLATIIYIASETQYPKGVMLTHEEITANILTAFSSYPHLETGAKEEALLFLPLTHIFARAFLYGHLAYGHSLYLSDPNHLLRHLKSIKPTILITVPRLLEKMYERIVDHGQRLSKFDRTVFQWALKLAQRYKVGQNQGGFYALQRQLADPLVFAKWRTILGDRLKILISGGAALRAELVNVFWAGGIPVLQGYGLTETCGVLCYNRGKYNKAGTVGVPIVGVKFTLAEDGEILVKAPFVMKGYYKDSFATQKVITPDGWLHTGDLGQVTEDGLLQITGVKKPLFKLVTGKYVAAPPLEENLKQSPLVNEAIAVGINRKFCSMLIFPNLAELRLEVKRLGINVAKDLLLEHPCVVTIYQRLIDEANCHLPYWSTVRKFKLLDIELTKENGLLKPDGSVHRSKIIEILAEEINSFYIRGQAKEKNIAQHSSSCPYIPPSSCPIDAQSLTHY